MLGISHLVWRMPCWLLHLFHPGVFIILPAACLPTLQEQGLLDASDPRSRFNQVVMVMEVGLGGSLAHMMPRLGGRMAEHMAAAHVVAPLLEVMAHCHARGVVHRDIKPSECCSCWAASGGQDVLGHGAKTSVFHASEWLTACFSAICLLPSPLRFPCTPALS